LPVFLSFLSAVLINMLQRYFDKDAAKI